MPELPEVETVRKTLIPIVQHQTISHITVLKKRIIRGDVDQFLSTLINETFLDISRKGKYLIFHLTHDKIMVSHLRMEGKYIELLPHMPLSRYARVIFHLSNGHRLVYDDSRQFGTMTLSSRNDYLHMSDLSALGPEPFVANADSVFLQMTQSSRPIKSLLLDQTILSGLGNIYADEVLFAANIHPLTPGTMIQKYQVETILDHSKRILNDAIIAGGSTIRSYHPGNGISGDFQLNIKAYGQGGKPCLVCGHKMKKIQVSGRGTTYCPYCQSPVHKAIAIAITGPIASGKSVLTNIYAGQGYPTLSADKVVYDLYTNPQLVLDLQSHLGIKITRYRKLDKARLRTLMQQDSQLKKAVEAFIHPLVEKVMIEFMASAKSEFVFVEVPLLYQAHMESLFDYVIGIMTSRQKQDEFLSLRGQSLSLAKTLNPTSGFQKYIDNVDYLIDNTGDYDLLVEKANEILQQLKKTPI